MKKSDIFTVVTALLIIFSMTNISWAQPSGRFALQSEINVDETELDMLTYPSSMPANGPQVRIGFRWNMKNRLGLDMFFGMTSLSWVKTDDAAQTGERPGSRSILAQIGLADKGLERDAASLRMLGRYSLRFNRWYEYHSAYWGPFWPENFVEYNVTIPALSIGLEPSYSFGHNFSIFSRFGMSIVFIPDSKRIDYASPEYAPDSDNYPLVKRNDSRKEIKTDGVAIGLRYHF